VHLSFFNPVKIVQSFDWIISVKEVLNEYKLSNPLIITSMGSKNRLALDKIFDPTTIFCDTNPNPTFISCQKAICFAQSKSFDSVIALGGGSVMDTAKVVMASLGTGIILIEELLEYNKPFTHRVPAIFLPTTHGTASEVTKWGTVWNMVEKKKYSISHDELYPHVALLDAQLTLSLPLDISLTTALDALSHSFEAIWNINANPTSTEYAIEAICSILRNIDHLKSDPNNLQIRAKLLLASNIAGLAFSNTKTAAAHSISYPLTIHYNIPHGIAASMSIIPLLKINSIAIETELKLIQEKLELKDFDSLKQKIQSIPGKTLKYSLQKWGIQKEELPQLVKQSFTKGRIDNNIVPLSENQVHSIFISMF